MGRHRVSVTEEGELTSRLGKTPVSPLVSPIHYGSTLRWTPAGRPTVLISRIRLKNWRNFRELDVPLRELSYLLGPNASGKSNLLDAFRAVPQPATHACPPA